tara:strand:- start:329 stop:496 length:168 start_codon:yes stop_codon:yes gene_type:complete
LAEIDLPIDRRIISHETKKKKYNSPEKEKLHIIIILNIFIYVNKLFFIYFHMEKF